MEYHEGLRYTSIIGSCGVTEQPPTEENKLLIKRITRIKAVKETAFWIRHFKEEAKFLDLDIYKLVLQDSGLIIRRIRPKELSIENTIICFAAHKEIFFTYPDYVLYSQNGISVKLDLEDLFKFLQVLLRNSIFCIGYSQNDMKVKSTKDFIEKLDTDIVIGFEVHTHVGKAFFISELNSIPKDWSQSKK